MTRKQLHKESRQENLEEIPHHETIDTKRPFMLTNGSLLTNTPKSDMSADTQENSFQEVDSEISVKKHMKFNFTNSAATQEEMKTFLPSDPLKPFRKTTPFELSRIINSPLAIRRGILRTKKEKQILSHPLEHTATIHSTPETSL